MVDSHNRVFLWQITMAAAVGMIWGVLRLTGDNPGLFFDLPWSVAALLAFVLPEVVWGLAALIGALAGGYGGIQLKKSAAGLMSALAFPTQRLPGPSSAHLRDASNRQVGR